MRFGSAALCLALIGGACSTADPVGDYLESVRQITLEMRNESIASIADGQQITRAGIEGVIEARQRGLTALQAVDPPQDVAPEHAALVRVLAELSTAGEAFMASTSQFDDAQFEQAVLAAVDLDAIVARIGTACIAVERRASDLGIAVDLAC